VLAAALLALADSPARKGNCLLRVLAARAPCSTRALAENARPSTAHKKDLASPVRASAEASFCGLASECVPGNEPQGLTNHGNSCEGNTVVMCNAGRIDRVDCLSLGSRGAR